MLGDSVPIVTLPLPPFRRYLPRYRKRREYEILNVIFNKGSIPTRGLYDVSGNRTHNLSRVPSHHDWPQSILNLFKCLYNAHTSDEAQPGWPRFFISVERMKLLVVGSQCILFLHENTFYFHITVWGLDKMICWLLAVILCWWNGIFAYIPLSFFYFFHSLSCSFYYTTIIEFLF